MSRPTNCYTCNVAFDLDHSGAQVDYQQNPGYYGPTDFCETCAEGNCFYCKHCHETYHNDEEDREFESTCMYCARSERENAHQY